MEHLYHLQFFINISTVALNTDEQITLELVRWCVFLIKDSSSQELGDSSYTLPAVALSFFKNFSSVINYCGDWNLPLGKYFNFFKKVIHSYGKIKSMKGTVKSLAPSPVIICLGPTTPSY